ncbi:MAG: CDGSH iron-sulfur domain-containing protein [Pirellulaceae bacterium]|jgi:CDGSH-type Zn-finger protein|nr:CDGSH iron-sulfur domain-containing protein [Pirellulaceae bacterium]MDP7017800.1 CDGSH iron-sulfur domain-containing protein [Pirellulaceae bacterium]
MADVTIRIRDDGPLLVDGDVKLLDGEGNEFVSDKPTIAICRCGASKIRPYCDGAHKECGFESAERAPA